MLEFLSGKKTYVGIILGAIWAVLGSVGIVDIGADYFAVVATLITAFTGVAIRLAIEKSGA